MAVQAMSQLNHRLPQLLSEPLSVIPTITSLLQFLNPQNPQHFTTPDPSILSQISPYLTHNLVIQIIKNQTNPFHSLFFFNWASNPVPNPKNYTHNHHCYIAITDKLLSQKHFSLATDLLESHDRFSDFMVGKFITAHGDLGHLRSAIKLFHSVKKREHGCCLFSYNSLLGVFVKDNRVDLAWGYFGLIFKEGVVKPDVSSYTIMIRGFCKVGKIQMAKNLFDEMGSMKNLVTCNTMVNGFCKKGLMEDAEKIVDEMAQSGCLLPDVVTYSTLIDGYCRKGEMVEALRCFDQMVDRNCEPNVLTYNALINGLCLNGDVDEARRMMTKMRLNGLRDNVSTHTSLLKGYCIAGRSYDAIKHFKEMVSVGRVDEKTYAVVVNEYCKLGRPSEAIALLRQMKERCLNPSVSSFNAVLRSLLKLNELDKAIHLVNQMPQLGCHPNFLSYSNTICGLVRSKGRMGEVEVLYNKMLEDGHAPDATMYSCLVRGYCEDGNEEMAMLILREMIDKGLVINLESFAILIKALCAKGKLFEAESLFAQMRHSCPVIDVNSYLKVLNEHLG